MERFEGLERWGPPDDLTGPVRIELDGTATIVAVSGGGLHRGVSAEQLVGRLFWTTDWWAPSPELSERVERWCRRLAAGEDTVQATTKYFRADGSPGVLELVAVPRREHGEVGSIDITALDITRLLEVIAHREDTISRAAMNDRLAQQRLRSGLDSMIDNVTLASCVRDVEGRIVDFEIEFANRASADGAGRTADELAGRRVCELYPAWRDSGMFDRFVEVVETGEPYIAHRLGYEDRTADGTVIAGSWDIQVSKLDDGYIAASRDVTEIVRTENEARAAALSAERERFAVQILQQAALAVELPCVDGIEIGVHYEPAAADVGLGGDWYDVVVRSDGRLALVIADVAGHGPSAAGFMVQLRNMLRTLVIEHDRPEVVLQRANQIANELGTPDDAFATCCVVLLDPVSLDIAWSLAGHPPPIVASSDGVRFLTAVPGPPIGVPTTVDHPAGSDRLTIGDRLVCFTDGLIESRHASIDDDLGRLAAAMAPLASCRAQDAALRLAVELATGDDDVALIVVDLHDHDRRP